MTDPHHIVNGLTGILDRDLIKIDPHTIGRYAVDGARPKAVIFPRNAEETSEIIAFAHHENLAVTPWGSGSKMGMGNPPKRLDLVIGTTHMNNIIDMDTANLTITAEAGARYRNIQAGLAAEDGRCYVPIEALKTENGASEWPDRSPNGCFLPIDPCCSGAATIGGIIATDSAGPRRLLYTLPRDMILGVKIVTSSGEIVQAGGKTVKNVSGYDVSKLMVGSMGSIGILCEMTFKLLPLPENMETLLLSFDSFLPASDLVGGIFETSLLPAAVEVMNKTAFSRLVLDHMSEFDPDEYVVAVALESFNEAVGRMVHEISGMAHTLKAKQLTTLREPDHLRFWGAVSDLELGLVEEFPGLITVKLNYPISEWRDIVPYAHNILSQNALHHAVMAHAGSGICLINLLMDQGDTGALPKAMEAIGQLMRLSREAGGNMIIQRAPVTIKECLEIWGESGSDFMVMKRLKEQLDPSAIMSPGRFVGGL